MIDRMVLAGRIMRDGPAGDLTVEEVLRVLIEDSDIDTVSACLDALAEEYETAPNQEGKEG